MFSTDPISYSKFSSLFLSFLVVLLCLFLLLPIFSQSEQTSLFFQTLTFPGGERESKPFFQTRLLTQQFAASFLFLTRTTSLPFHIVSPLDHFLCSPSSSLSSSSPPPWLAFSAVSPDALCVATSRHVKAPPFLHHISSGLLEGGKVFLPPTPLSLSLLN